MNIFSDFKRIFSVISIKNKIMSIIVFFLMGIQSAFELIFLLALSYMGTAFTDPDGLKNILCFKLFFWFFPNLESFLGKIPNTLLLVSGLIVLVSGIKGIVTFLTAKLTSLIGERISIDICNDIMSSYLYRDYIWHLSSESSQTFQRLQWRSYLSTMLSTLITMYSTALTIIVLFLLLVGEEPILTITVLLVTLLSGIILYSCIRRTVDRSARTLADCSAEETRAILCATRGIRDVIIYRQQKIFLHAITNAAQKAVPSRVFTNIASPLPTWVLETVAFSAVLLAFAYLIFVEQAAVPRIAAAVTLLLLTAWRVLPYVNRVVGYQIILRSCRPMAMAVLELLETLRASPYSPLPDPDPTFTLSKEITLINVSFRYPGADHDSLTNLSFSVPVGKKIGLIGPSGAGKSTVVGILSGLLHPSSGEFLVDGNPLGPAQAAAYSTMVGYVPQQAFLFAGNLGDNIAFSHWGKPWKEADVMSACHKAAVDFVDNHPQGLQQPIGENGAGLSGGQAQRVCIARALYSNPQLLIFDEATSALDQVNENSIMETINHLASEITSIIVAHRLTTVEICDEIIWIEKGRVVMQGDPKVVLAAYRKRLDKNCM